ncbi:MAG: flagellar hook-basal body complex protein FliE [Thermodesulfobacteriota bacterium]
MDEMNVKIVSAFGGENVESRRSVPRDPLSDFKQALSHSIDDLNKQLTQADQTVKEMALGKTDVHQAMLALEQAYVSLRMMIQVRNKIIAAYEEIMRMQL